MVRGWWSAIVLSFAVVRGWWPAIVLSHLPLKPNFTVQNERFARFYHLPWSGVGGLLLSYHLLWSGVGGQVRRWWPAIVLSHVPPKPNFTVQNERFARFYHLLWSGVGGLLLSYHLLWPRVGHLPPKTNFIV